MGSVVGAIAGKALGAVAGSAASRLIGGRSSSGGGGGGGSGPGFINFKAGGMKASIEPGGYMYVRNTPERQSVLNSVKESYKTSASDIRGFIPKFETSFGSYINDLNNLIGQVEPGFGALTNARVQAVRDQRDKALSDVNADFGRRGIGGSSIAAGTVSSLNSEFAQKEAAARATSFLEELDVKTKLLDERARADLTRIQTAHDLVLSAADFDRNALNVDIEEFDKQLETALTSISGQSGIINQNAALSQELAMQNAQGRGALASYITRGIQPAIDSVFNGTKINWN